MTREEILTVLENAKLHAAFESDVEVLDACIGALREQEERSKGCEHCRSEINKRMMRVHGYACCTACGRRLEEV